MRNIMIGYKRFILLLMFMLMSSGLLMINFSAGDSFVSEAEAHDNPYYMTSEYCWYDGEPFWVCRVGDGFCHIGSQDCCGEECED
jgi:phosphoribosyl-AMP cyclohydrolase